MYTSERTKKSRMYCSLFLKTQLNFTVQIISFVVYVMKRKFYITADL